MQTMEGSSRSSRYSEYELKREKFTLNLYRKARQDIVNLRRQMSSEMDAEKEGDQKIEIKQFFSARESPEIKKIYEHDFTGVSETEVCESLNSPSLLSQLYAVIGLQSQLKLQVQIFKTFQSLEYLITKLLNLVRESQVQPLLKYEVFFAIMMLTGRSGQQCEILNENGGIPVLLDNLKSKTFEISVVCTFVLKNMAIDSAYIRDKILRARGLKIIMEISKEYAKDEFIDTYVEIISLLCRGRPHPKPHMIYEAFPFLTEILSNPQITLRKETIAESIWAILFILNKEFKVKETFSKGFPSALVNLIDINNEESLIIPNLKIIQKYFNEESESEIELFINHESLISKLFFILFNHSNWKIRREACAILAQIAGLNPDGIMCRLQDLGRLNILLSDEIEPIKVKKQICCLFGNLSLRCDPHQICRIYIEEEIVEKVLDVLKDINQRAQIVGLWTVHNMLEAGKNCMNGNNQNVILNKFLSLGGMTELEKLEETQNQIVLGVLEKIFQTINQ